jgi:TIR domain
LAGPVRVFVSHSIQDLGWCSAFVATLEHSGIDAWYDQAGLSAGMQWVQTIQDELQQRDIFLLIVTPRSWQSKWVQQELALALVHHKQIIGVIHEATPQLSGFILIYQLLDVVGQSPQQAAQRVAEAVRTLVPAADGVEVVAQDEHGDPVVVAQQAEEEPPSGGGNEQGLLWSRPPGTFVTGSADFIAGIEKASAKHRPTLQRLAAWALSVESNGLARLHTYYGKQGLTLLPYLPRDGVGLVSLYNMNGAYVQFWRSVFERRAPQTLPQVERIIAPKKLGQGTWTPVITEELLEALSAAYQEAEPSQAS